MPQLISPTLSATSVRSKEAAYCLPSGFGCSLGTTSQKLTQVMESAWGKGSVPGHWKYTLQLQGPSAVLAFLAWGQKV